MSWIGVAVGLTNLPTLAGPAAPVNVAGLPAASLPLAWTDDGLPIGIQLVASYGGEPVLVRLSAQVEDARPWADRRPPVS